MIKRLLGGELQKLLTWRMALIVAVLIICNIGSLLYYADDADQADPDHALKEQYAEAFDALDEYAASDPSKGEELKAYYDSLSNAYSEASSAWADALDAHLFDPEWLEANADFEFHSPSSIAEGVEDWALFSAYDDVVNDYRATIKTAVSSAEKNLERMETIGIGSDNQIGDYQRITVERYSKLLDALDEPYLYRVRGWDCYLSYENGLLIAFLAVMLLSVQCALSDREAHITPILRTCKHGRSPIGLAKAVTVAIAAGGVGVAISLSSFLTLLARNGFSNPFCAVQNVEAFTYCPYPISIGTAALLQLLGLTVALICFAELCLLLTALLRNPIAPLCIGGLLIAFNLLIYWSAPIKFIENFVNGLHPWKVLNLFGLASGSLLHRSPEMALSDVGRSLYPVVLAFFALVTLPVAVGSVFAHTLRAPTKQMRRLRPSKTAKARRPIRLPLHRSSARRRVPSIFRGEFWKHCRPLPLLLALVLLTAQLVEIITYYPDSISDSDQKQTEYIEHYGDRVSVSTLEAMEADIRALRELTAPETFNNYSLRYGTGELSADEYYGYVADHNRAQVDLPILEELYAHAQYLYDTEEASGIEMKLFYDQGYKTMFRREFSLYLYLLMLILFANVFSIEYSSSHSAVGFSTILRTTVKGRGVVWRSKYAFSAVIGVVVMLLTSIAELIYVGSIFGLAGLDAPLRSIERYASVESSITLGGYLVVWIVLRCLGGLLLVWMLTALSCLLKNRKLTLALTAAITLLPYALYYFGIKLARYFDFTTLFSGDRLWLNSWEQGSAALLVVFAAVAAAITAGLTAASYRKFCK